MVTEKTNYSAWMQDILEDGESFRVHFLKEKGVERFHLRAVFSEIALATSHYGFARGNSESETTDYEFKGIKDLEKIRRDYLDESAGAFEFDSGRTIEIKCRTTAGT